MSHGKIRENKNCLNCSHHVEERFCGHCGQENVEPRQPFHYLFTHFFEDFTHYDGQFWGTLKNLFFKPGKLTNIYLAGKRQKFVPPVKLYIFVSFITFLVPGFLPSSSSSISASVKNANNEVAKGDSILKNSQNKIVKNKVINVDELLNDDNEINQDLSNITIGDAVSKEQFDSLYSKADLYYIGKPLAHKVFELKQKGYTLKDLVEKFISTFTKALPKVLFVYLPIFAFLLWLVNDKKKWWYFDHGVFTLHYFSVLLLITLFYMIGSSIVEVLNWPWLHTLGHLTNFVIFCYSIIYFYKALKEVYQGSKGITLLKSSVLLCINTALIVLVLLVLVYYSFLAIK